MQQQPGPGSVTSISGEFDALIIIDRRVDMITPMLTQLTYEGLIDESLSIKNCMLPFTYTSIHHYIDLILPAYVLLPATLVTPPAPSLASGQSPTSTAALSTTPVQAEKKKKYQLSSSTDPLFGELRDLHFAMIGTKLSSVAHRHDQVRFIRYWPSARI
jgi:vacuolar protein sorting-associated protein 33A